MKHLKFRHYVWLHFKLAVAAWAVVYGIATPIATAQALGSPILLAWGAFTVLGALAGCVGLIMSEQINLVTSRKGILIEVGGLSLMAVGPLIYFTTQASIFFQQSVEGWDVRFGLALLGYSLFAGVLARLAIVMPRYRLVIRDMIPKRKVKK